MDFRTEVSVQRARWTLELTDPVLTIGSCFAQSIGEKFVENKFRAEVNPFGTSYHPIPLHKLLRYTHFQEQPQDHTYTESNGIFHSFDFHSSFSHPEKTVVQQRIREQIGALHFFLKNCRVLIITYGTSWVYERVDTGETVANCHKMPGTFFLKRLTPVQEIVDSFMEIQLMLKSINPKMRYILTVSPVRHTKDTLALNSVSKAVLRTACQQIVESCDLVDYFPAYEIMMDDLRDYRFYKSDLIHPTGVAEDYIWQKFVETYFSEGTRSFIKEWGEIMRSLSHRPLHEASDDHRKFLVKTLNRLEKLKPLVDVEEEIARVTQRLNASVK